MLDAKEALRGLIDRIVLVPDAETGRLAIHLEGALAALLTLSTGHDKRPRGTQGIESVDIIDELELVAGVGFEPTTFRL